MENCEGNPSRRGRLNDGFKQRIVGALVLAALAVIFLPSLLDREAAGNISETSQIPAEPDIRPIEIAEPQRVADALPAPAPEDAFQPDLPEHFANPEAPEPAADDGEVPEVARSDEAVASQAAPKKGASPLVDAYGLPVAWVVQVGSYRDESRAEKLRLRLMDGGYKAYTRAVETDRGRLVRVFVGPKVNKADAQQLKRELDTLLQAQTLVLQFKA
ncbi:SPOR domain-containing protein [Microbulbifer sp. SSSA002]|uniref:SPOR domain-containing protein n=1 Tax=Microbulbifer sp. SSSA002 TaxID=3243376 RepID=UPI0040396DF6